MSIPAVVRKGKKPEVYLGANGRVGYINVVAWVDIDPGDVISLGIAKRIRSFMARDVETQQLLALLDERAKAPAR